VIERAIGPFGAKRSSLANGGIVMGIVGFVLAAVILLAVLLGGNAGSVNMNSPSYFDGTNFANANYSNASAASTLCNDANVPPGDKRAEWITGCFDAWATARLAINNNPGMPGLNVGSP
jgi:hypothetical protein